MWQSKVDRKEAILGGTEAVKAAMEGKTGVMIGFKRLVGKDYNIKTIHIPIE